MRSILRRAVVIVATLGLSGVAVGQQSAFAEGQDKQKQTQQTQQIQQNKQQSQQKMSLTDKAQYVDKWANSEVSTLTDAYSSDGFMLMHSALDDLTQQLQQQPVGGGPVEGQSQQQLQQQRQQIQQALQQIRSQQQQLEQAASQLSDNQDLMQHPQQFRQGAVSVVNILDSLQQSKFTQLSDEVDQVRNSVEQIQVNQPLAAQQDQVKSFFVHSSQVLSQMAEQIENEQAAIGGGPSDSKQEKQKQQKQ